MLLMLFTTKYGEEPQILGYYRTENKLIDKQLITKYIVRWLGGKIWRSYF